MEEFWKRMADRIGSGEIQDEKSVYNPKIHGTYEKWMKSEAALRSIQSAQFLEAHVAYGDLAVSADLFKNSSPLVNRLMRQIISVRNSGRSLRNFKLLERFVKRDLQGKRRYSKPLQQAKDLAAEWRRGPNYRKGRERALRLSQIWHDLDCPLTIHRDDLWKTFCQQHGDLIDSVQNEQNAKSQAFKLAKLDFLKSSVGGSSQPKQR